MFNESKYTKWYFQIVSRARTRGEPCSGSIEHHHVIPASLGGTETVALTPREHFICHLLLPKMMVSGSDKKKMYWALHFLLYSKNPDQDRYRPSSRTYEQFREKFYGSMRGKKRIITDEHRQNIVQANKKHKTGKPLSEEHKLALRAARPATLSEDHKAAIGAGQRGKSKSPEHCAKISATLKANAAKRRSQAF